MNTEFRKILVDEPIELRSLGVINAAELDGLRTGHCCLLAKRALSCVARAASLASALECTFPGAAKLGE